VALIRRIAVGRWSNILGAREQKFQVQMELCTQFEDNKYKSR